VKSEKKRKELQAERNLGKEEGCVLEDRFLKIQGPLSLKNGREA